MTALIVLFVVLSVMISIIHLSSFWKRVRVEIDALSFFILHLLLGLIIWPTYFSDLLTERKKNNTVVCLLLWVSLGVLFCLINNNPYPTALGTWLFATIVMVAISPIALSVLIHLSGSSPKNPRVMKHLY